MTTALSKIEEYRAFQEELLYLQNEYRITFERAKHEAEQFLLKDKTLISQRDRVLDNVSSITSLIKQEHQLLAHMFRDDAELSNALAFDSFHELQDFINSDKSKRIRDNEIYLKIKHLLSERKRCDDEAVKLQGELHSNKPQTEYRNKLKEIENRIIVLLDNKEGSFNDEDGLYTIDYKLVKKDGYLDVIQTKSTKTSQSTSRHMLRRPTNPSKTGVTSHTVRLPKPSDAEIKKLNSLLDEISNSAAELKDAQAKYKVTKDEINTELKSNSKEDEAWNKYLKEKENIPPKKFKVPDTEDPELKKTESARIRKAIVRLQKESLVGRTFEFDWIKKEHNENHATQMLALRFGITHVHRTIIGKVKSHDVKNRVELYLPQYKKIVNCSIEQTPEEGKWGISTFFQLRTDWSMCENNTDDVPSGLSQEIDMKYNLNELAKFHKLIMKNYLAVIAA